MRLSTFIRVAREDILAESMAYTVGIPVLSGTALDVLRNHLPLVLDAIATDLEQPQSQAESIEKSLGQAPAPRAQTAAQTHGAQRARLGLNIEQVVAEFRVLRSCVLRLWAQAHEPDRFVIDDTMRFNEAIDQAVAESVAFHAAELERWRDIALGVLAHDLRGPVSAMVLSAEVLARESSGKTLTLALSMLRSGRRLTSLLDSLLEYNKATLGNGMSLSLAQTDLALSCQEETEMLRLAFPHSTIHFRSSGDTLGLFDAGRVREALANLISNAAQHSLKGTAIEVSVQGTDEAVEICVDNQAEPIPPEVLNTLFEPMKRHGSRPAGENGNLGLGLFIVREIARAHHGEVSAVSSSGAIRFKMVLPRRA